METLTVTNYERQLEELKQSLLAQKIIQPHFNWPVSLAYAKLLLHAAYVAEVSFRNRHFELDDYTKDNITRLARYLVSNRSKFGVLMCGVSGNGKSSLLNALQNSMVKLNELGALPRPYDKGLIIEDAVILARECADVERFNAVKNTTLLGLEDIGRDAERILVYGNPVFPIIDIIEYRYSRQLPTFITTNLNAEELTMKYGKRVTDRFNEMEVIIFKKADSYRRMKD